MAVEAVVSKIKSEGLRKAVAGALVSLNLAGATFPEGRAYAKQGDISSRDLSAIKAEPEEPLLTEMLPYAYQDYRSIEPEETFDEKTLYDHDILTKEEFLEMQSILKETFRNIEFDEYDDFIYNKARLNELGEVEVLYKFSKLEEFRSEEEFKNQKIFKLSAKDYSPADIKIINEMLEERGFSVLETSINAIDPEFNPTRTEDEIPLDSKVKAVAAVVTVGLLLLAGAYTACRNFSLNLIRKRKERMEKNPEVEQSEFMKSNFEIKGGVQPTLSFELRPNERIISDTGSMMHFDSQIKMRTVFGRSIGFSSAQTGPIRSIFSGESFNFQKFDNESNVVANLTLTPSQLGEIARIDLSEHKNGIIAAQGAFFAATNNVELSVIKTGGVKGVISRMGYYQQKFKGEGEVFLFAPGALERIEIKPGMEKIVDPNSLFIWEPSVKINFERLALWQAATSGEGLYVCKVSGEGSLWVTSRGYDLGRADSGGIFKSIIKILTPG